MTITVPNIDDIWPEFNGSPLQALDVAVAFLDKLNEEMIPRELYDDAGERFPKCGTPMQRYKHSAGWQPRLERGVYKYWDRCKPCRHFQMYDDAYVASKLERRRAYAELRHTAIRKRGDNGKLDHPIV